MDLELRGDTTHTNQNLSLIKKKIFKTFNILGMQLD